MWLPIDRTSRVPLTRQVYGALKQNILAGKLQENDKLPPSRVLAKELGVSRIVVVEAYEQLLAEGYVTARQGAGTFVSKGVSMMSMKTSVRDLGPGVGVGAGAGSDSVSGSDAGAQTGRYAQPVQKTRPGLGSHHPHDGSEMYPPESNAAEIIDFKPGVPALDLFPGQKWAMLARKEFLDSPRQTLGYQAPEGLPQLRHSIADYLFRNRGLDCSPDQIVITSGAAQALVLAVNLIFDRRRSGPKRGVMEDPASPDIRNSFLSAGVELSYVPVDHQGMITSRLPDPPKGKENRLIYVTPSHQFPLGGVLPVRRRIRLIEYARLQNGWIIEDDYDSEFRYGGPPLSSLYELDPERVVYIGTFSKTLFPGLRIGYCVLPWQFVKRGRDMKWLMDIHTSVMDQLTLDAFIREGFLDRHLRNIKGVYQKRRDCLAAALADNFPGLFGSAPERTPGGPGGNSDKGDKSDHDTISTTNIWGLSTGLHLTGVFDPLFGNLPGKTAAHQAAGQAAGQIAGIATSQTAMPAAAASEHKHETAGFLEKIIRSGAERGVKLYPAACYGVDKKMHFGKIVFGFSNLNEHRIQRGIEITADILRRAHHEL